MVQLLLFGDEGSAELKKEGDPTPAKPDEDPVELVIIDYSFLGRHFGHLLPRIRERVAGVIGGDGDTIHRNQLTAEIREDINRAISGCGVQITFYRDVPPAIIKLEEDAVGEYWQHS